MSRQTAARRSLEHFGITLLPYLGFCLGKPLLRIGDGAIQKVDEGNPHPAGHVTRRDDAPCLRSRTA